MPGYLIEGFIIHTWVTRFYLITHSIMFSHEQSMVAGQHDILVCPYIPCFKQGAELCVLGW